MGKWAIIITITGRIMLLVVVGWRFGNGTNGTGEGWIVQHHVLDTVGATMHILDRMERKVIVGRGCALGTKDMIDWCAFSAKHVIDRSALGAKCFVHGGEIDVEVVVR